MDSKLDKLDEKEQLKRVAATNLFEKADFVNGANLPLKVLIPELGGYVTYKKLTWMEGRELNKVVDVQERSIKTIAKMIGKANPHLDIEALLQTVPLEDIGKISECIYKNDPLSRMKPTK
jgi:hypothetical protein